MLQAIAWASSSWLILSPTSSGCIVRLSPTRYLQCLPNASRARAPIFVQLLTSKKVMFDSPGAARSTTESLIWLLGNSKLLREPALAKHRKANYNGIKQTFKKDHQKTIGEQQLSIKEVNQFGPLNIFLICFCMMIRALQ